MNEFEQTQAPSGRDAAQSAEPVRQLVARLEEEQRTRWQRGERVLVEVYLAQHPQLQTEAEGIVDLLYNEFLLRERAGERPRLEDYLARFPQLAGQLRDQFEVHGALQSEQAPSAAADQAQTIFSASASASSLPDTMDLPVVPGYELVKELGRGGMGVVYLARQVALNRLVALKMILAGAHAGPEDLARFRREAEAVARLQHPHIVQIHEIGEHKGLPYLSLEFVEGGSLVQKLGGMPLTPRQAAGMVGILAKAMHLAHRRGIVHRDLKPANVLLTAHGKPKITDFGLAKKLDDPGGQTASGAIMGTPSYMAPEQARGDSKRIGPAADIYALGAVLYELLTGRPPFGAATPLDTVLQVLNQEPVSPRLLQPTTPRDLEAICLKCLHKDPRNRYATARELTDDLRRFLRVQPIQARLVGRAERLWRRCRRNPTATALIATVFLSMVGGGAAGIWYVRDRAERTAAVAGRRAHVVREIEVAEQEATRLGEQAWTLTEAPHLWESTLASALSAIKRAEAILADAGELAGEEFHERVRGVRAELDADERGRQLVATLEQIRLEKSEVNVQKSEFAFEGAIPKYREAFRSYGLEAGYMPVDEAAELIRRRRAPVQSAIVAALDDWFTLERRTGADRNWLAAVVAAADTDKWRTRVREAVARKDRKTLEQLVDEAQVAKRPAATLILLSNALRQQGGDDSAIGLLRRAQLEYPDDFWVNHDLGWGLHHARPPQLEEAISYYRIAVALRPRNCGAELNLGSALHAKGDFEGAIAAYQKAINLEPKYARAHGNLGSALHAKGDLPGAIAAFQKAIDLDRKNAKIQNNLGDALHDKGDLPGAIAAFQIAIDLDPKFATAPYSLGNAFRAKGDLPGAIAAFQKAIEVEPDFSEAHCNLGQALRSQAKFAESLAAYRRGHWLGSKQEGWRYPSAQWVVEAERMVELDRRLPSIVSRQQQPTDAHERMEYAQLCGYKRRFAAGVRLCQEAFAAQPALADDVRTSHRYNPACWAARAGTGQGEDAGTLNEPQRAGLRKQALDWLHADLAAWTKLVDIGKPNDRALVHKKLRHWQTNPDLAALRDEAALAKLPPAEGQAWQKLWDEVATVLQRVRHQ